MNVNEARSHYLSRGINDALGRTSETARHGPYAPIAHGNIDTLARRPTAIDDLGTANDEVVHRVSPLARLRRFFPKASRSLTRSLLAAGWVYYTSSGQ